MWSLSRNDFVKIQGGGYTPLISLRGDCHPPPLKPPMISNKIRMVISSKRIKEQSLEFINQCDHVLVKKSGPAKQNSYWPS